MGKKKQQQQRQQQFRQEQQLRSCMSVKLLEELKTREGLTICCKNISSVFKGHQLYLRQLLIALAETANEDSLADTVSSLDISTSLECLCAAFQQDMLANREALTIK
ncbi:12103_t:CDS:2 [Funneliformis mosseae]|uniref:12103_t:CDS:1 n=1 Tax=Funneliformis mosseae TaxID=27381 RepID=A0A9N9H7S5_FUNMO|nr:12103_t:CDS:2 [Funneliformis mosseae]